MSETAEHSRYVYAGPEQADWTKDLKEPPPVGLRYIGRLPEATGPIAWLEFSPDGRHIGATSPEGLTVWDVETGRVVRRIPTKASGAPIPADVVAMHPKVVFAWSPSGDAVVLGSGFGIRRIDLETGKTPWSIRAEDLPVRATSDENPFNIGLSWSPNGEVVAIGTRHGRGLLVNALNGKKVRLLSGYAGEELAWSPDGGRLVSGGRADFDSADSVRMWDPHSGRLAFQAKGHSQLVDGLAWSPRAPLIVTVSRDRTIRLWDPRTGSALRRIEVHTNYVRGVSFSPSGDFFVSTSWDKTVRFWDVSDARQLAVLHLGDNGNQVWVRSGFSPDGGLFAVARADDVFIFQCDAAALRQAAPAHTELDTVRYTTAKLVLVGDSGVGKTGLGWRLSHGEFKEHESTHGQQFWVVDRLNFRRDDGTECEAVIWDLAGQHVYRPVHVIFLERVDLAVVVFDPTNRQESLKGVEFWLEQLAGRGQLPPTVLVGGRLDRGAAVLSRADLAEFCQHRGVTGGYIETSAKTGEGVDELLDRLRRLIPWDEAAATITTVTFKRVKDHVLALKESAATGRVLIDVDRLYRDLTATDASWRFTVEEMLTAIQHLENHGYVALLTSSAGLRMVLLAPAILPNLASSIVLLADRHPHELGALNETALLGGGYPFPELADLDPDEREVLIDATVVRFLRHNVCFRERLGVDTVLIFPNLIRQRRPLRDDEETFDDVSYVVRGRVENAYAALAVLLGYSQVFTRVTQWQNQTLYEIEPGQTCGLRVIQEREGELEFVLSYSTRAQDYGRALFQGLFERFLAQREVEVTRFTPVVCPAGHRQARSVVVQRRRDRRDFLFCSECGEKVPLAGAEPVDQPAPAVRATVTHQEGLARLRSEYEANLARVKAYTRSTEAPRCYVSHAGDREAWVAELRRSLREAGLDVLDDPAAVRPEDAVLMVCTPAYWRAWTQGGGPVRADLDLLGARLRPGAAKTAVPLLVEGSPAADDVARLAGRAVRDFRDASRHVLSLFDLVLELYAVPPNGSAFAPLRREMADRWKEARRSRPSDREVFVSYAWEPESQAVAAELGVAFEAHGVRVVQDTRDLDYKGDIRAFMQELGRGRAVLVVLSERYLRSENCMFELLAIAEHGEFRDRIFPIVLSSARIYKPLDRLRHVHYWERQIEELDAGLKTVSAANLDGFRTDIDLYAKIRAELPRLSDLLKNINALSPSAHRESGYAEVVDKVLRTLDA